jgi:hypothetical protein
LRDTPGTVRDRRTLSLFPFDANTPRVGKTKLIDIIAIVATGRPMARTAYPDSDEEMRKRITSIALAGDRLMLIDNVASTFGGSALDAVLTATTWKDRNLGRLEMTPELPLFTVWYASGNNLTFRGDVLGQLIPCRLESQLEHPELRDDFAINGDLLEHVRKHRGRLVAAALTLVRAYHVAGCPAGNLKPFGGYEAWSAVVRQPIHWAYGVDPCATRPDLAAADPEVIARTALVQGWSELPEASETGLTVAEALRMLKATPEKFAVLHDTLMESSRSNELPTSVVVGKRLKKIKGRVVKVGDEFRFLDSYLSRGMHRWVAKKVAVRGGGGGGGGGCPPTRAENFADKCNTNFSRQEGNNLHHLHHLHHAGDSPENGAVYGNPGNWDAF